MANVCVLMPCECNTNIETTLLFVQDLFLASNFFKRNDWSVAF